MRPQQQPKPEGTSEVKSNSTRPRLTVTGDGKNVANHVGARLLSDLADTLGLTEGHVGGDGADQAARRRP
jgi:hypothetical protein